MTPRSVVTSITRDDEIVCDFCAGQPVTWRYPVAHFDAFKFIGLVLTGVIAQPMDITVGSNTDWAADDPCHDLIERDDREALAKRAADTSTMPGVDVPYEMLLKFATGMQRGFFENRTGPARPHPDPDDRVTHTAHNCVDPSTCPEHGGKATA